MVGAILSLFFFIYVAIGATSYWLIAGSRADWSHFVTYVWTFFWPFVILLGAIYYSPVILPAIIAAIIISWWFARRPA
jgi:hypothetical protein